MKKIRIRMAGVVPVTALDSPADGANNKQKKKKWYKKVIGKLVPPVWPEESRENPTEEKKEITAEDIKKMIEMQRYGEASKGLIELERQLAGGSEETAAVREKDLESLYEKLKAEVFGVIRESPVSTEGELLRQAIQAIVEQQSEDLKSGAGSRPRKWMEAWKECVKQSVEKRLQDLSLQEASNGPASIVTPAAAKGKLFKQDLVHVVTHVKEAYPEEFDVCNAYAKHYHHAIRAWTQEVTDFQLSDKDSYLVLCWVQNWYPNEILKNPKLAGHIDDTRLGSLLPQKVLRSLENSYLDSEAASVSEHMNKALDFEVQLLKKGNKPKILGSCHHSELHIDVIQCYNSGFQQAAEIRPEVEDRLAIVLAPQLEAFLTRYKKQIGEYIDKCKNEQFYRETCIAHLNCCLCFRNFLMGKESKLRDNERLDMSSLLLQFEEHIYDALLQDLFVDLKTHFKKMSQGSSPFSYQTMLNIIRTSEDFMKPFHTLKDESYMVLSGKIHLYLVKEHVTRILKRKISYKTVQQMQTLANQIRENAELIESFSTSHTSCEDWLKPALPKLAEIIRLQDLNAIELEVATLVQAYPDIRNKQIEAILYMKGNLRRSEVKSILMAADTVERRVNDKQKLFELTKTP
ncbi:tumor necrosis factor alpha-induced protein 2-like [Mantella aurantiaca]